ncbi:MotA/TolQ/ExbB proton channel family protein [uncultured Megasphaera sp.]|uniref:MotA/TolQ/ExbB proton channel family protein n=1 Tax=uncultured Megasphaera sp. TaxID=165188 RepID=UPI002659EE42|nr:MotA/TolQ/ExbB proton channel family protein [uncultured Megasphaera sp.]
MESLIEGIELFQKGGAVMYVLLACSLFVVYIGAERWLFYRHMDSGKAFAEQFYTYVKLKKYADARDAARQGHGGLARILTDVLDSDSSVSMTALAETQSSIFIAKLRHGLYYLSVVVTMAPLLGLLGTISGMITSFSIFHVQSGQAMAITGGVGEALIATAFGLCVAILALAVHAYFTQRLDRMITDMELCFSALELLPRNWQGR